MLQNDIENVETDEARIEERDEDEGLTNRVSISIKIDPNNKDKAIFGIERKNNVSRTEKGCAQKNRLIPTYGRGRRA